ncbi:hypothetical protein PMAYCL1PPCAC_20390, partial [Pristionchus mayeri]
LYLARRKNLLSDFEKKLEEVKRGNQSISARSRRLAWVNREEIWREKREAKEMKMFEARNQKNRELIKFLHNEGPFPLLDLPDDPIIHIFSLLHMKDRLRARVNKRLNAMEAKTKYYMEELNIEEPTDSDFELFLRRISRNTTIGTLYVELSGNCGFHRNIYHLIKEFDSEIII